MKDTLTSWLYAIGAGLVYGALVLVIVFGIAAMLGGGR